MTIKILVLNGPPGCGKDTLALHIVKEFPQAEHIKFANELKAMTHRLYNSPLLHPNSFEDCKDAPNDIFYGLTPRQAYINVSEIYIKPIHGQRFFGEVLAREIKTKEKEGKSLFVISDGGFIQELIPLTQITYQSDINIVKIYRDGCNYKGDSRNYLNGGELYNIGITNVICIVNNSTLKDYTDKAIRRIKYALQS